jgi:MoxR-like ATPase
MIDFNGGAKLDISQVKDTASTIRENIEKVIVGKSEVIDMVLTSLLCCGHVLLEDVPGLGKTVLAKSLAKSIDSDFSRIQFTPDLLPSDLTGVSIFNQKEGEFVFKKGPLFTNIVLADEINRATPRTQSALLECMEEHQISADGVTYILDEPFFVIATQNPLETQGTFPLPEAQMDRFFMRLSLGYPTAAEEATILDRFERNAPLADLKHVVTRKQVMEASKAVTGVKVSDDIKDYIVRIVSATRTSTKLLLGLSPRGSLALMRAARAYAAINGRDFVIPSDVKKIAPNVTCHRVMLKGHSLSYGAKGTADVINEILATVPVPTEEV